MWRDIEFQARLNSDWAFLDVNKIITPNYFHGSGMAAIMWVEHFLIP